MAGADVLATWPDANAKAVTLQAIEGATLTGFLAALGILRLLDEAGQAGQLGPPGLGWEMEAPFRAVLVWPGLEASEGELVRVLAAQMEVARPDLSAFNDCRDLKAVQPRQFQAALAVAAAAPGRLPTDILGALSNDGASVQAAKAKATSSKVGGPRTRSMAGAAEDTGPQGLADPPWSVMNGAGHRHLLDVLRILLLATSSIGNTEKARIAKAVFGPWAMQDKRCSLRFDGDSREHAYRWSDPVSDPVVCEAMVQVLAVFGLSFLPAVPQQGWRGKEGVGLSAPCCMPLPGGATQVSWPIWEGTLGVGAVQRLLLLDSLLVATPGGDLASRGVRVIMRAERRLVPGQQGAISYAVPQLLRVVE